MLRSDLCDFNDAYIVMKGNVIVDKKTFTANDFDEPNNTADNRTATNTAKIMRLMKKSCFLKTMLHLSTVLQKFRRFRCCNVNVQFT